MKKAIKLILVNLIYVIIMICVLYNIIFSINTTISGNDYFKLFGISLFNMENDLMQDDLNKNDLVIVKEVAESELNKGDIIAYTVNGQTRINKIINQNDGYATKSNKNYQPDIEVVKYNDIIGKVTISVPFCGAVIDLLQSKVTSFIILFICVLYFLYNRYLLKKKMERIQKKKLKKGPGLFF